MPGVDRVPCRGRRMGKSASAMFLESDVEVGQGSKPSLRNQATISCSASSRPHVVAPGAG